MKHIQIIITLTVVVLISSLAVFFVEDVTTPLIDAYNLEQANLAKFEVLPELTTDDEIIASEDFDFIGTSITELIIIDGKGYIYTAEFQGFQSVITYMVGMDLAGNITGYKTLTQGDTPGLGALIADTDFYQQFIGMKTEDAAAGNFDGLAGATITTGGLIGSLDKLIEFHNVEFEGAVVETPEARLVRLKEEITEVDAVITDDTSDYDLTGTPITKVETTDNDVVIYTVEVDGYNPGISYIVAFDLDTNDIIGFRVIEHNETIGLGAIIEDSVFQAQFDDLGQDEIDDIGGSTAVVTLGAIKGSLEDVVDFHKEEFEGETPETDAQKLLRYKQEITAVDVVFTDDTSDYDLTGIPITKVETTNQEQVIYTVEVDGYNPGIIYLVAFDLITNDIVGFRVIEHYETVGLGSIIEDSVFQAQFDDLAQDEIDDIGGTTAVITLGAIKASLEDVVDFHKAEFEGEVPETAAQKLLRYKQEITVVDAVITDATANYDLTGLDIEKVELANDGTDDVAVIYTIVFVGYNTGDVIEYIISFDLDTNDILGFRVIYQNETPGYGDGIEDEDYYLQFVGMAQIDALNGDIDDVAGTSGAPVTMGAFKLSLNEVVIFHKAEFEGVIVETDEERLERLWLELFPTADDFVKVTRDYAAHYDIEEFYEVYDVADVYLGNLYHVKAEGASYSEETYVEFFIGIAADKTFTGLRMWDENETPGKATDFYLPAYGDTYTGDDIEATYTIDDIAGSTVTNNALQDAALSIATYHMEIYLGVPFARAANVDTSNASLVAAFPGAVSFNSVYYDYEYESYIFNIYEALDASNNVLGYVYYGNADGYGGTDIEYTWGVNVAGITQQLIILNDTESWDSAESSEWANYDGSAGYWPNTPWLNNFEGVTFSSILSTQIDGVAGVSTTTDGMLEVLEGIAQYDSDESVGGAG